MATLLSGISISLNNHLYLGEAMAEIKQDEAGYYYVITNENGCWKNWEYVDDEYSQYYPYEPHILNNADNIYDLLNYYGWSHKAICAVLGNMIAESAMNPAQGEFRKRYLSRWGYGLCQWTPSTKYTSWAEEHDHDVCLGTFQVQFLNDTGEGEWDVDPDYNYDLTWEEFISYDSDEHSVEWLAMAFFRNYERGTALELYRQDCAIWYDDYFQHRTPLPPSPPDPAPYRRYRISDGMPLWMMLKKNVEHYKKGENYGQN